MQYLRAKSSRFATRDEAERSSRFARCRNLDPKSVNRHHASHPVGPFDNHDAVRSSQLVKAQRHQVGRAAQAIDVHVIQDQPSGVFVHQREGRAGNLADVVNGVAGGDALDEMRLARAERTDQADRDPAAQRAPERLAEGEGLLR